jgi:uncharacterized protein (TIGR02246 family)
MNELEQVFETYATAVLEKDERAFLNLYHPEFMGFDMWGDWVKTAESWRQMVNEWFVSLKAERVHIGFSEIREIIGMEIATAHAIVRYTAVAPDGEYLRHLDTRLTWVAKRDAGSWKIIHEHTSAPIDPQTGKAQLQRG